MSDVPEHGMSSSAMTSLWVCLASQELTSGSKDPGQEERYTFHPGLEDKLSSEHQEQILR